MLCQLHILDTTAVDLFFQEIYLANGLVNLQGLLHMFYEIDLLLEYQNGKFKRFRQDHGFFCRIMKKCLESMFY